MAAAGGPGLAGGAGPGSSSQSFSAWYQEVRKQQAQQESGDVEQGLLGGLQTVFGQGREQASGFASRFIASIRSEDGVLAGAKNTVDATVNYGSRLKGFIISLLIGVGFYALAFFVGLPVIVFRPVKFALCATLGSIFTMGSFSALVGPKAHLQSLCKMERLPFTAAYVGSLVFTLYASLVARSYLLVVFSTGLQMAAFVWYLLVYIPGGAAGIRVVNTIILKTISGCFTSCTKIVSWCIKL